MIKGRRSIRHYEDREVPQDILDKLFEAVRWAPSWTNSQCWDIVVVRDAGVKGRLQETVVPKNPAVKAVGTAPVVLAVFGRRGASGFYKETPSTKFGDWLLFDLGAAVQNLCLTAHAFGLGTVIVGLLDHDRARAVLNGPGTHELIVLIPLGYPAKISLAPKRKEISEFVHYESF
jgi:nitroreductase